MGHIWSSHIHETCTQLPRVVISAHVMLTVCRYEVHLEPSQTGTTNMNPGDGHRTPSCKVTNGVSMRLLSCFCELCGPLHISPDLILFYYVRMKPLRVFVADRCDCWVLCIFDYARARLNVAFMVPWKNLLCHPCGPQPCVFPIVLTLSNGHATCTWCCARYSQFVEAALWPCQTPISRLRPSEVG